MDPASISALLASLGLGAYVPVLLALVGLASAISTIYPPTWPLANVVHLVALLKGNAKPATPAGSAPMPIASKLGAYAFAMGVAVSLMACSSALTPAQLAAAQAGVTVVSAAVPGAATVLADGQLLCQGASTIVAVIDAATGKPYLVTGKAPQTVANACAAIGSSYAPVAPPTTPATVAAVPVTIPAGTT